MITLICVIIFVTSQISCASVYEESISDLLVTCNAYQKHVYDRNRTGHACEREDPDGDFSYFITPMKARYSKRDFLCVLFFKTEYSFLDFKLLFTHGQFKIDAYGIKYNEPNGSLFESSANFAIAVMVLLPEKTAAPLEILEWRINGEDMCPACGEKSQVQGLISGGTETKAEKWPWHVSLWKKSSSLTSSYICGGTILNKKWIISAAHCMFSDGQVRSENTLSIRIGTETRLSANFKQFSVSTLIVHEEYNKETYEHDIALLKLKETLSFSENFRAICYSELATLPKAATGVAVGYGSTDRVQEHSDSLRQVEIPVIESEECRDTDIHFFNKYLFRGNFCAGEIGVLKGVCSGDSGGGFYVRINSNWYLQGVTSNTKKSDSVLNPSCNYASYAIFTNVTFYGDWINAKIISV